MKLKIVAVSIVLGMYLHAFHIDNLHNLTFIAVHPMPIVEPMTNFFRPLHASFHGVEFVTDEFKLARLARDTLTYIETCGARRGDVLDPTGLRSVISLAQVKSTLEFIVKTAAYDQAHGTHLLNDQRFLANNFDVIDWKADMERAKKHNLVLPDSGAIRTTNYAIFCIPGSMKKTKEFSCALYHIKNEKARTRYTKQEIVAGAFEKPKHRNDVKPLIWVTRSGLEDAQGMVMVKLADGTYTFFNIHKNNGFAYDRNIADVRKQKRYWFFNEMSKSSSDAQAIVRTFQHRRDVVLSGDVYNIGVGKVIALLYRNNVTQRSEIRLGILADMGGAFINNLYQVDVFSGVFTSRGQWREQTAHLPSYAHAYILKKKEGA